MTRHTTDDAPVSAPRRPRVGVVVAVIGVLVLVVLASCSGKSDGAPSLLQRLGILGPSGTSQGAGSAAATTSIVPSSDPAYALIFKDEFDGPKLDATRWSPNMAWGNFTTGQSAEYHVRALSFKNGKLLLSATEQPWDKWPYESGAINSAGKFEFTYGYAEIRAKCARGQGIWPAFWLGNPNEDGPVAEIDALEVLGSSPEVNHMAMHYKRKNSFMAIARGTDLSLDYHTFGVDWQPDRVIWYQDGVERARVVTETPSLPMYLVANLQVGGKKSWSGMPDKTTEFPAVYSIDSISFYKRK